MDGPPPRTTSLAPDVRPLRRAKPWHRELREYLFGRPRRPKSLGGAADGGEEGLADALGCGTARSRRTVLAFAVAALLSYFVSSYAIRAVDWVFGGEKPSLDLVRTVVTTDAAGRRVSVQLPLGTAAKIAARAAAKGQTDNGAAASEFREPAFRILYIGARADDQPQPAPPCFPRIIHQTWKDRTSVPAKFKAWSDTWKAHHPGWTHYLWTDDANRGLVASHYPWFLYTYDRLPHAIQRVDAARLFYMHRYGGVYADLDVECLRPLDPLAERLRGRAAVFSMGNRWESGGDPRHDHDLPNAFMASGAPGHPFWLLCAGMVADSAARFREAPELLVDPGRIDVTEAVAGPVLLRRCVLEWRRLTAAGASGGDVLAVVPAPLVFPYDWAFPTGGEQEWKLCWTNSDAFDREACLRLQRGKGIDGGRGPFAITYWSKTWAQGTGRVE
ncbi:nucleotide-diphospho-sugar transferase [Hyaloraphidium curvatum]|nr:nucleotide-diphospho-sugar transferase [Hyaloraphidium curvatum]